MEKKTIKMKYHIRYVITNVNYYAWSIVFFMLVFGDLISDFLVIKFFISDLQIQKVISDQVLIKIAFLMNQFMFYYHYTETIHFKYF